MVRLTVLYNLKPFVDEEEFFKWRLGEHQSENAAMPGVLHTDFTRLDEAWPEGAPLKYRFMTTLDWPDHASFAAAFYSEETQTGLQKNLEMLADPLFLVGEILNSTDIDAIPGGES